MSAPPSYELHETSSSASSASLSASVLPTPASSRKQQAPPTRSVPTAVIIPIWIVLSSAVIIYNNYVYNTLNFKFPVFTVTWHLMFAAIGTRVLQRTTNLLDGAKDVHMTRQMYIRNILPIGILFSGSLVLSNTAYLYLSVSYIQMLKAFTPVSILLLSWGFRINAPSRKLALIVLLISTGVALTSHGERAFDLFGFLVQAAAVAFEASRLLLIQLLLHPKPAPASSATVSTAQEKENPHQMPPLNPLLSLHYYAPPCALINLCVLPFTEGFRAPIAGLLGWDVGALVGSPTPAPIMALLSTSTALDVAADAGTIIKPIVAGGVGMFVWVTNALVAFLLNVAAVYLVGAASGLVLTLAGVFKDILLITGSVVLFASPISGMQVFGYSIALVGLLLFKLGNGK